MSRPLHRLCLALTMALAAASEVRADRISFEYVYEPGHLRAGQPGGVTLWTGPVPAMIFEGSAPLGGGPTALPTIPLFGMKAPPGAPPLSLDTDFRFRMLLWESESRLGELTLAGRLRGTLGPASSTMTLTFAEPSPVRIGDHLYQLHVPPVVMPPASPQAGVGLVARLSVSQVAHAPEPSALALAAVAALTCLAGWRRRGRAVRR
jgi:hypothetical protein